MRILLVKTSSLGDVVHNLPVVNDLHAMFSGLTIDWCVEEAFTDIPSLHPGVSQVISVALRRWRKTWWQRRTWAEIRAFRATLRAQYYDAILDTQGLIKSALITAQALGLRYGYSQEVAREPWAARFYDESFMIPPNAHAVVRNRWLAAAAFNYPVDLPLSYGLGVDEAMAGARPQTPYAVLFTATSRDDKLWDPNAWIQLAQHLAHQGIRSLFPSGSARERERATEIAQNVPESIILPPQNLRALANLLAGAKIAIGVDTGLIHLACALNTPAIALYVSTHPELTGLYGTGFVRNLGAAGAPPTYDEVSRCVNEYLQRCPD